MAKRAREPAIKLRYLGFCGADDSVEPLMLAAISAQHPWVEWGVLFRDDKVGQPRYASFAWLERLGVVNTVRTMRLAGHLCGCYVDSILRGDVDFVQKMNAEVCCSNAGTWCGRAPPPPALEHTRLSLPT